MQRKTKKVFDIIKVIFNLFLLTFMILCLTTKNANYYSLYWLIVTIMFMFELLYLLKWNKVGEWNVDKKDSKDIRYFYDGITTGTIMLTGVVYLGVVGFEFFEKSVRTNAYIIILVYVLFTISILCNYLAISTANKDTKELAEKTFKYKK